ncbi:MAG: MFS transporter [Solirubrobacteraceae bacterium]
MAAPAPLKQPAFRSLWQAGLISEAGDWLLFIALPIVVYRQTGSALGTSFAFLAELGPAIALSALAGRLADRVDRRRLLLVVTVLQSVSILPLLFVGEHSGLAIVYGVILTQSALSAMFEPAENALLPSLVPTGELVSANSLVALGGGVARLVGGPLGGLLLAAGDLRAIVIADVASYALAAALIRRVPATPFRRATPIGADRPTAPSSARFLEVLRHRRVRVALAVTFVADIAQGIFLVLFVVFVAQRLHGGAGETGLLRGVQAIGAIGAGLVLTAVARHRTPVSLMRDGALAFGVVSLLVWNLPALTTSTAVFAGLFAIAGAPGVFMVTGMISFLQQSGEEHERGRIFGALGLADNLGEGVGMIAAGVLTGPLGLSTILDLQGCIYLAVGVLVASALGRAGTASANDSPLPPTRLANT